MSYQGNKPATSFESPKKDRFTGISGTTCSLTYPVSSVADILVWVNGVKQDFTNYSVSGSTLTLGGTLVSADIVEVTYVGRTYGSIIPSDASVGLNQLSATGTKSSSTFLRGDNTFATAGADADNYFATSGLSSKDLGIGLHIKNGDSTQGTAQDDADSLVIENSAGGGMSLLNGHEDEATIAFGDKDDADIGYIKYHHNTNYMAFGANASERMRITGDTLIVSRDGNYTDNGTGGGSGIKLADIGGTRGEIGVEKTGTSASGMIYFYNGNGGVGSIITDGSATSYGTSSDYRLKENAVAISDGITRLKTLKPYRFNFKADKDKTVDGFFAHEVTAVPEAIQGEKDGAEMQSIDQAKLVPLLTSALQEAITKIETLEARVQTLENA